MEGRHARPRRASGGAAVLKAGPAQRTCRRPRPGGWPGLGGRECGRARVWLAGCRGRERTVAAAPRACSEGCLPRPEGGIRATERAPEHRHVPLRRRGASRYAPPLTTRRWWRRCSTARCLWRRRWATSCSGTTRACAAPRTTTACAARSSPSITCAMACGKCGAPAELRRLLPRCAESDNVAVGNISPRRHEGIFDPLREGAKTTRSGTSGCRHLRRSSCRRTQNATGLVGHACGHGHPTSSARSHMRRSSAATIPTDPHSLGRRRWREGRVRAATQTHLRHSDVAESPSATIA